MNCTAILIRELQQTPQFFRSHLPQGRIDAWFSLVRINTFSSNIVLLFLAFFSAEAAFAFLFFCGNDIYMRSGDG